MEGNAEVSKLKAVSPDDPRLAVAALLIARSGVVIGRAVVLSSEIAVTTGEVANSATAKVDAAGNDRLRSPGSLMLAFPQFVGSPGVYPIPAVIQAVDEQCGFGVLRLSVSAGAQTPAIMLPVPIPSGLLGTGAVPMEGTECDVFCAKQQLMFRFSGRAGGRFGSRFTLHLGGGEIPEIGAPVFSDYRLVGIVVSSPGTIASPAASFVEVLSVAAMAESKVTPAVRNLLSSSELGSNASASVRDSQISLVANVKSEPDARSRKRLWSATR